MCQIWAKSNNPLWSYGNSNYCNIWSYELKRVSRVALCSGVIFTQFNPFVRCNHFYADIHYVTLWPWHLILWPWTFVVHQVSRVQSLYKVWAKLNNSRLSYWRYFQTLLLRGGWTKQHQISREHRSIVATPNFLLWPTTSFWNEGGSKGSGKIEAKFHTF